MQTKMDKLVWAKYSFAGDELVEEATEVFLNRFDFEEALSDELKEAIGFDLPEGEEREAIVSMRVNQEFFRNTLLTNYNSRCCLTGLSRGTTEAIRLSSGSIRRRPSLMLPPPRWARRALRERPLTISIQRIAPRLITTPHCTVDQTLRSDITST